MPAHPNATNAGPHFGPDVVGEQEYQAEKERKRSGRDHFGPAVVDYPTDEVAARPGRHEDMPQILLEDERKVVQLVRQMTGVPRLEKLLLLEMEREDEHFGGREAVLDAIEARIVEIENGPGPTPPATHETGTAEPGAADGWPDGYSYERSGAYFAVFAPDGEQVRSETPSGKWNGQDAAQEAAWRHVQGG